jgi:hypothetical protein
MYSPHTRSAVFVGCLLLALVFLAPSLVQGDEWNRATRFTINHPFQVPNLKLDANTPYVIRLLDSPSTRSVVQIYNEDQTKMLTEFLAISAERTEPTDNTYFSFMETNPGFPMPIKQWFYPGRLIGLEFVYPKEQAAEIALHMRGTAVTETAAIVTKQEESTPIAEKPTSSEQAVVSEEPNVAQNEPQPEVQPEQQTEVQIAQNTTVTPPEVQETRELPRTAGELPLIALIGVLCLGAGFGLKVLGAKI